MTRIALALLLPLGLGAQGLVRRPLGPAPQSGWVRVPLDAQAQRAVPDLWVGDAEGRSVPFLREEASTALRREALALERLLLGRDAAGRAQAEFTPKGPAEAAGTLHLDLDLEGPGPWVCEVRVERRAQGGAWIRLDARHHVHQLDTRNTSLELPWDGERYRLTLVPVQGRAPRLAGLSAEADLRPAPAPLAEVPAARADRAVVRDQETWTLTLDHVDRVAALDVALAPPAAPLRAAVGLAPAPVAPEREEAALAEAADPIWNLPALESRAARIDLAPALTDRVVVRLPPGAHAESVKVWARRESLFLPAEAGKAYFLHLGGRTKPAAGDLHGLPLARELKGDLALGAAEPDPQGLPVEVPAGQRLRPVLPWIAGLAVVLLGFFALRLLREGEKA